MSLFDRVPLSKNYKDVHEDSVLLRGPPSVVRSCFLLEIAIAASAFAVSFYLSYTSTVDVTTITYESLGSSYECAILSPRSDATIYSEKNSELVQFSSARLLYDDCTLLLRKDGLDVCNDTNRENYVLTFQGVSANDTSCIDLHLDNNFKFCYGSEENTQLRSDLLSMFPRQSAEAPSLKYKDTFYFTNVSGTILPNSAPFTSSSASSIFVTDQGYVYTVAKDVTTRKTYLYQFSPLYSSALPLLEISGGAVAGLAVGGGLAHVLMIGNNVAALHTYNMTHDSNQIRPLNCEAVNLNTDEKYQYLGLGDDGTLYVICSSAIEDDNYFTFYSMDTVTFRPVPVYVDAGSVQLESAPSDDDTPLPKVSKLSTLVVIGNYAYFSTGNPFYNLLEVDLTPQPSSAPTFHPTPPGSPMPTMLPPPPGSPAPSTVPTRSPTAIPTRSPTAVPTCNPTVIPTMHPSAVPTFPQTPGPTVSPGDPTTPPTEIPSWTPTEVPTTSPTVVPTLSPSLHPSLRPSASPSSGGTPGGSPAGSPGGSPAGSPGGSPAGPGPGPGRRLQSTSVMKELDEMISLASHATKTILVSALTSALLHVAGFDGTDVASTVHAVVKEHTRYVATPATTLSSTTTDRTYEEENQSYTRRLASVPLQPVTNLGQIDGAEVLIKKNKLIFIPGSDIYFNTTSNSTELITAKKTTYYTATAVQIAYSYAVCNHAVKRNFTLNVGTTTAYYYECDDINGIYYQNHAYITVPTACAGTYSSASEVTLASLTTCPALYNLASNFTSTDCDASVTKVCKAEYTDNPPYSCTKTISPDFLTTLGSALSNASALWGACALLFALSLKRIYPGGILYRTYKENHRRIYIQPGAVVPQENVISTTENELDKVQGEA